MPLPTPHKAWIASMAAHGLLLAIALTAARREGPLPPTIPVRLLPPGAASSRVRLPAAPDGPRARPERAPRPIASGVPIRIAHPLPAFRDPVAAQRWDDFDRASVDAWTNHSLVAWLDACRAGNTDPDSVLERARTPEEIAREAMAEALHRDFLLRIPQWQYEKFAEEYRKNFPLMR
jgi:hypothetical protein